MPKIVSLKDHQVEHRRCRGCGLDQDAPELTPDQMIELLRDWQAAHTPFWHWSGEELDALRRGLLPGDVFVNFFAQSVVIKRGGIPITWERGARHKTETETKEVAG